MTNKHHKKHQKTGTTCKEIASESGKLPADITDSCRGKPAGARNNVIKTCQKGCPEVCKFCRKIIKKRQNVAPKIHKNIK